MILTADYPPPFWSGIGAAVQRQAEALSESGAEVHLLYPGGRSSPAAGRKASGFSAASIGGDRFPIDPRGFDWIHLHSLALTELAFRLRRRTGTPVVYTVHSLLDRELTDNTKTRFWSAIQRQVMAASDAVVFLSRAERDAAVALLPELASRACVIPNAMPAAVASAPVEREGLIVFAGRFAVNKGIPLLVDLLPQIRHRKTVRFVLAGGHGDPQFEAMVAGLCDTLGECCSSPGWLDQSALDALFARAALVLVPSYYEPFGLVALEAMRMGAPVLAAATGGLAEIVTPDSGGRLVHTHQWQDWLEQALEITSEPEVCERLSLRGPVYVEENFRPTKIAARLCETIYSQDSRFSYRSRN
jgi:glycosyltransferase involved in cell wall biosynthesis